MVVVWLVCVAVLRPWCVGTTDIMAVSVVVRHDGRVDHKHDCRKHNGRVYSRSVEYTQWSCPYYCVKAIFSEGFTETVH